MADAPRPPKPEAVPLHLGGEHVSTWTLGEYRIVRLLGEGAMGKVYEAIQGSLERRVALKVLPEDFARDAEAVARFEREARAAAALVHPAIVPIYQFGCEGNTWFYAMEYVVGRSLRDLLREPSQPLRDQKKVAKYVLNVALGLDDAHGRGVVHRDVKPDNILVREDDQALITDFGLARKQDQKAITQAGALMGTPTYMAPEQAMGQPVDRRADVWALGVVLYECLSGGTLPFPSQRLRELLVQITQEEPPPLRSLRPDVSVDLAAIAHKCLRKDPDERYQTAKELADDLIRFFRGDVVRARDATLAQRALRTLRKHPVTSALGGLLLLVVAGTLAGGLVVSRVRAVRLAEEQLAAAEALVAGPLAAWREAARALDDARARRDGAGRRDEALHAQEEVARRLAALRDAEQALLDARADADAPAARALELARDAVRAAPAGHAVASRARQLAGGLLEALRARAERDGDEALVSSVQREQVALGLLDPERARRPRLLTVETAPPGARVTLHPVVVDADRRWSLGQARDLGPSPVVPGLEVEPGEYVLSLDAPGHALARVPLHVRRGTAEEVAVKVELAPAEGVPPGFVFVPAGEFFAGGDPAAVRPLFDRREPVWVAGFFMGAYEVTVAEYAAFLDALPEAERGAHLPAAWQLQPRPDDPARLVPRPGCERQPIAGVRQESARAYCAWLSARLGRRFRLPTDAEWEKAARGVAGRFFPWGDGFDPDAARLHHGDGPDGVAALAPVGAHPRDQSIFGVFDMAGNLSEWVEGRFPGEPRFGVLRGGSWARGPEVTRLASREPVDSSDTADFLRVRDRVGFRVAFD